MKKTFLQQVKYGDWMDYEKSGQIAVSTRLQNNGSIYLHVYGTKSGYSPDPKKLTDDAAHFMFYKVHQLNKYKKKRYQKTTNLLTGNYYRYHYYFRLFLHCSTRNLESC